MAGNRPPLYLAKSKTTGRGVWFSGEGALLTVGPPGTGKSRGVVIWNLLRYTGSLLVTDPKGELARWSASYRSEALGSSVSVLDPYGLTGIPSAGFNPLTGLLRAVETGTGFRGEAERLGKDLLPDLPDKDPFWRNGGRLLIVSACLYLAALRPESCTLPHVHRLLWEPESALLGMASDMEAAADALGGALVQYGANLKSAATKSERQFAIFQQEAREALSIYAADEPVGRVCAGDLDFSDMLTGRKTVYLTLPPHLVASHGRWMGLVTSQAAAAVAAATTAGDCVYLLDEFPNLGRLQSLTKAVAELRSKGLRVWAFVQDLAQLEAVYGKPEALALLNQAEVLQVLGCNSVDLAKLVEQRAGTRGVHVERFNLPDPLNAGALPTMGVEEKADPIMPAARVLNMQRGECILLRRGFPVLVADLEFWNGDA